MLDCLWCPGFDWLKGIRSRRRRYPYQIVIYSKLERFVCCFLFEYFFFPFLRFIFLSSKVSIVVQGLVKYALLRFEIVGSGLILSSAHLQKKNFRLSKSSSTETSLIDKEDPNACLLIEIVYDLLHNLKRTDDIYFLLPLECQGLPCTYRTNEKKSKRRRTLKEIKNLKTADEPNVNFHDRKEFVCWAHILLMHD